MALGELASLIIEILCEDQQTFSRVQHAWCTVLTCCREMVEHGPWTTVPKLHGREVDHVEVDVVLAHELEELNMLWVKPPTFPLRGVVCSDTRVADRCIKLEQQPLE